jgi:hypothetical protein
MIPYDRKKHRVRHDYGSVGSATLNIVVVKETRRLSNTAIFKVALPTEP